MRLGLCSGAAPDASLDELLEAAGRRGLTALELREGDAHGIGGATSRTATAAAERAAAAGVGITGYRATRQAMIPEADPAGLPDPRRLARLGEQLGAAILVDGEDVVEGRLELVRRIVAEGVSAALVVRGQGAPVEARRAADEGLDVAWEADPGACDPGAIVAELLVAAGPRLRHVRLHGGGPESAMHEGRGIGEMTGRLALAGYDGTVILTPTSARYRIAWQTWLGRRGGWGCGGKTADPELVHLSGGGR